MGEDDRFAKEAAGELRRIANTEELNSEDNTVLRLVADFLERQLAVSASRLTTS